MGSRGRSPLPMFRLVMKSHLGSDWPCGGPAAICHGARRAVLCLLAVPTLVVFGLIAWLLRREASFLPLLIPGLMALPVYAMIPCLHGEGVPLSAPIEEAKS